VMKSSIRGLVSLRPRDVNDNLLRYGLKICPVDI
jgi:hypothetical protein